MAPPGCSDVQDGLQDVFAEDAFQRMGCAGSRFDEMPVTGSPGGLQVLPASSRSEGQRGAIYEVLKSS